MIYYALLFHYTIPRWIIEIRTQGEEYCISSKPHTTHGPFATLAEAQSFIEAQ